jgi:hypothetical protein
MWPTTCPRSRWRPEPGVLHQLRFGSGRHRAEDRARLSPRPRRGTRTRIIGRERGYHGVGFGGISVGGMVANRKTFGRACCRRRSPAAHAQPRRTWRSRAASPPGARIWPTNSSASSPCTTPRPSRPSSSSRCRVRSACSSRRKGYLREAARDLHQARHPADLRRGHHRLRPHGQCPSARRPSA